MAHKRLDPNNQIEETRFRLVGRLTGYLRLPCGPVFLLLTLVACRPVPGTIVEPTIDPVPEAVVGLTGASQTDGVSPEENTSLLTSTPIVAHLQTQPPTISHEPTATRAPAPDDITQRPADWLLVYDSSGIKQVNLSDQTQNQLLEVESDWIDWGARFAQSKEYLAYWTKSRDRTELWFTPLTQWQPERILLLDDVEYDFAAPLWGVNDRYLLFYLSVLDATDSSENTETVRTYIFDTFAMNLVSQPYWPGICSILAPSPQTDQLALWCDQKHPLQDSQLFFVLEPDDEPWSTDEIPEALVDNCLMVSDICDWSDDGEFVAYSDPEFNPDSLSYTQVTNPLPHQLIDEKTKYFSFPRWSPDSQLLYYSGACAEDGLSCPNIMSVAEQEVIWRAQSNSSNGDFGIIAVGQAVWSPDSRRLAIPILDESGTDGQAPTRQILVFDIMSKEVVLRIPNQAGYILDLVWLRG